MLCIEYRLLHYYEARQRKNRADSWNDCHSRVEVYRQQAQKKICLDSVRAFFNTPVWLQAGQYLALAAQIPAKQKSGCPRLIEHSTSDLQALQTAVWYWSWRD
jgi:hypothetical protein